MTTDITTVKPGMFGLSVIGGKVGKLVRLGQRIVERQDYTYTHAFLVVDNNRVIEAEPGGATFAPLEKYADREDVVFSDLPVSLAVAEGMAQWRTIGYTFPESDAAQTYEGILRRRVVAFGQQCEGVEYNYLDYFALALERMHIHLGFVQHRVERQDRMICSQLVDWAYQQVGIHLFDDGRMPFDVTPGDLEGFLRDHSGLPA